ncbi:MAG TPA: cytidylate kinase-like family protein [Bacteroidales bacterium]|nr:cytidylate kinase-like family protein [Bacteroidales bacterium]
MRLGSPFVITINRQLGSGGAYIGQKLAQKLNIFYADREIIDQAAKKLAVLVEDLQSHEERIGSFWQKYMRSFAVGSPEVYLPPQIIIPTDRELFNAESDIIKRIAREHSAVIIGRCGCHVLSDHPNRFSLYFHSDSKFRTERIMKMYNVTEAEADRMIARSDKERAQYYKTFTGKEWIDARQYDLTIDTGKIGLDNAVDYILKYLD